MDWTEILVNISVKDLERAEAIAHMTVPYGFYTEDYSNMQAEVMEIANIDLIDEELLKKDPEKAIIHIYISNENNPLEAVLYLDEHLSSEKIEHTVDTSAISEEDWANNWKQHFKPLEIGESFAIVPSWTSYDNSGNRKVIDLDPGSAFGTGTHETTRLCLCAIEKILKDGNTFLDVGCGSGILSIAAGFSGASSVTGIDIDPMAVKIAKENGSQNGMTEPFYNILCGNLTQNVSGKYDVIVANIVADVIIILLSDIRKYMKNGTFLILSGIIDIRENAVMAAIKKEDLNVKERFYDNGWVCLIVN